MSDKPMNGLTSLYLKSYRLDDEKPLALPKSYTIYGTFLEDDILREHSGGTGYNNRGLLTYETDTMPMIIEGNRFFDFINHDTFTAAIDLANNSITKVDIYSLFYFNYLY